MSSSILFFKKAVDVYFILWEKYDKCKDIYLLYVLRKIKVIIRLMFIEIK